MKIKYEVFFLCSMALLNYLYFNGNSYLFPNSLCLIFMGRFFPLTEGNLHTVQNLSPFLLEEDKEELVIQCTAKLMTCDKIELSDIEGQSLYSFFQCYIKFQRQDFQCIYLIRNLVASLFTRQYENAIRLIILSVDLWISFICFISRCILLLIMQECLTNKPDVD